MQRSRDRRALPAIAAIGLALGACGTTRRAQLEAVAKDWCETIRASQVVPVYPLTQDLQPGDVFLVQIPIDRQQDIYREKGFLPLDQHVARLDPTRYAEFYGRSFVDATPPAILPKDWLRAKAGGPAAWTAAPRAAFPTYAFTVQRGAGLSLALPVQGVPVGLSLLGSDSATGSIAIADGRTLGIDLESAWRDLQLWAARNADFLAGFAPRDGKTNYVRFITRIYLTGKLAVQLTAAESFGAGLDAGAPKPIELLNEPPPEGAGDQKPNTIARYQANLAQLNKMLAESGRAGPTGVLPGGSVRVTAAAGRTIALEDTFDPPLVLGYLGFDCAILAGGALGPPVRTHSVLDDLAGSDAFDQTTPFAQTQFAALSRATYLLLDGWKGDARMAEALGALDRLARHVDTRGPFYSLESTQPVVVKRHVPEGDEFNPEGKRRYLDYLTYEGLLKTTERSLGFALAQPRFRLQEPGAADATVAPGTPSADALRRVQADAQRRLDLAELRAEKSQATAAALRAVAAILASHTHAR